MTILSMAVGRLLHYYRQTKEEQAYNNSLSYEDRKAYELEKMNNERARYLVF